MQPFLHKVIKNTTIFSLALILQKILSFIYFSLVARLLGAASLGEYMAAISFALLFSAFVDMGVSQVLIREIAKDKEKARLFVPQALVLKMGLSFLMYGVMVLVYFFIILLKGSQPPLSFVLLAGGIMVVDSMSLTIFSCLRGLHNLWYESISAVAHKVIVMGLGLLFLSWHLSAWVVLSALLTGGSLQMVYGLVVLVKKYRLKLVSPIQKSVIKQCLHWGWPFAFATLCAMVMANFDVVWLRLFWSETTVGVYSVASKMVNALQFIPMACIAAVYPAFSALLHKEDKTLAVLFHHTCKYLLFIAFPAIFLVHAIGGDLIVSLYKESYEPSLAPLLVLLSSLAMSFLNFPFGYLLNAASLQKVNSRNLAISVGINVVLNLWWIPVYGFMGSAWATVIAQGIYFVLNGWRVNTLLPWKWYQLLIPLGQTLVASLMMFFVLLSIHQHVSWYVSCLIAPVVYVCVLLGVGGISRKEVQKFKGLLKKSPHETSVDYS